MCRTLLWQMRSVKPGKPETHEEEDLWLDFLDQNVYVVGPRQVLIDDDAQMFLARNTGDCGIPQC